MAFQDDMDDLAAFDESAEEPTLFYEEMLKEFEVHGSINM